MDGTSALEAGSAHPSKKAMHAANKKMIQMKEILFMTAKNKQNIKIVFNACEVANKCFNVYRSKSMGAITLLINLEKVITKGTRVI